MQAACDRPGLAFGSPGFACGGVARSERYFEPAEAERGNVSGKTVCYRDCVLDSLPRGELIH